MELKNGYYQLPPGKMANAVTWMELTDLDRPPHPAPPDVALQRLGPATRRCTGASIARWASPGCGAA